MCGIAGLISYKKAPLEPSVLRRMVELQAHRGPDDIGFAVWGSGESVTLPPEKSAFLSSDLHVGLGHLRLSILDLSPAGRQPMSSRDARFWITYNGEVYNYLELANELKPYGFTFKTGTDTEVILAAFEQWGREALNKFNGMWSFAIFDQKEKTLFAARDRFGVKPFYYSFDENFLGFATEIKALVKNGFGSGRADRQQVGQFLLYGDVNHEEQTCFEGIKELPPGHFVQWNIQDGPSTFIPRPFYSLPEPGDLVGDFNEIKLRDEIEFLIEDSIKLRLRSDVEVGSCLSGGLDSSYIVKKASDLLAPTRKLKTFTSSFPGTDVDEWTFARMAIDATQAQSFQVFPNMNGLLDELDQLIWHQEEPFRSSSIFAQWNVMGEAHKQGIKVLLDGQGADEIMLGYHFFIPLYLSSLARNKHWFELKNQFSQFQSTGLLTSYESLTRVALKTLFWSTSLNQIKQPALAIFMNRDINTVRAMGFANNVIDSQLQELTSTLLPSLLRHEDRNSMAFSIEARTPYLDYRLVEAFLKMPVNAKLRQGWTKPFLRELMNNDLPKELVWRKTKLGFATPEKVWYEKTKEQIKDELLSEDSRLEPWLKKKVLSRLLSTAKWALGSDQVWRLYCVYRWMKKFNLA